jgi:hypothetical protein
VSLTYLLFDNYRKLLGNDNWRKAYLRTLSEENISKIQEVFELLTYAGDFSKRLGFTDKKSQEAGAPKTDEERMLRHKSKEHRLAAMIEEAMVPFTSPLDSLLGKSGESGSRKATCLLWWLDGKYVLRLYTRGNFRSQGRARHNVHHRERF